VNLAKSEQLNIIKLACFHFTDCSSHGKIKQSVYSKCVDLTGLLGDIKEDWGSGEQKSPSGVQGRSPGRGSGDEVPRSLSFLRNYT